MYTIYPDDDNWDSDSNHAVVLGVHKSPNGISDGCCIAYKAADVTHLSDLVLPVTLPYTREVKVVNVTVLPDNSGSLFGLNRVYCHEGKALSLDPKCFPMLQGELDEAEEQMTSQAGTKCPVTKFCGKIYSHAQKADWSVASVVTSDLNDYAFLEDAGVFAIGFWGISTMGIETLNLACNYFVTGNGMNFGTKGYPHFLVLNVNGVIEVGLADEKLGIYVPMKEPSYTLGTATTDLVVNTSPGMVTIDLPKLRGGDLAAIRGLSDFSSGTINFDPPNGSVSSGKEISRSRAYEPVLVESLHKRHDSLFNNVHKDLLPYRKYTVDPMNAIQTMSTAFEQDNDYARVYRNMIASHIERVCDAPLSLESIQAANRIMYGLYFITPSSVPLPNTP